MKRIFLLCLLALNMASAPALHAEKADSNKPLEWEADYLDGNDTTQVRTLTGNVVVKRGTMVLKADKMVLAIDPAGYQVVTLLSTPNKVATFRQKRDGGQDQWMDGQAERIDYDEKTELVKLTTKAKLRQLDGAKPSEEVEGEFISYDSRTENYKVANTSSGDSKIGAGRVRGVINPRNDNEQKGK